MNKDELRQYFMLLENALDRLEETIQKLEKEYSLERQDSLIQRFEFCTELFWKNLKKLLAYEKILTTTPRDVLAKAYQSMLIDDEAAWLSMIDDRNTTSHIYQLEVAEIVASHIPGHFAVMKKTYEKLRASYFND